jgi:hypothetical protein
VTAPSVEPLLNLNDPELDWKRFERFCLDLVKALPDVNDAHLYGLRGENQQGIDIHVDLTDGRIRTIQCRRVAKFGKPQAEKTIRETTYKADEHQIWATCPLSAEARKIVAKKGKWTAWDIEQLSSELRRLPREDARWIVEDHLGSAERRRVLGPPGELVVAAARQWFARADGNRRALQTNQPLVGRDGELSTLAETVLDPDVLCVLVVGRGGIGKTRMLRGLAETQPGRRILMLREGVDVTAELAAQLPMAPFDLMVDDAHHRSDLGAVLATTIACDGLQTVVLATRPHRVPALREQLHQLGIPLAAIRILDSLAALPVDAATELAVHELDDVHRGHGARLAQLTRDAPAILVLASRLIAEDEIDAETLIASPVLREHVLTSYREERLGQLDSAIEPSIASRLLSLVAAVQPVATTAPKMITWLATELAEEEADVRAAADALADAGLLQGSARRWRVAPDILSNHLVHEQCIDRHGKATTRPRDLIEAVPLELLGQLFANLAELDWRLGRADEPRILEEACQILEHRLMKTEALVRKSYLEQLVPSAAFLASWVIGLARQLLDHPAADTALLGAHIMTDADTHVELVRMLENASLDPACTRAGVRLLWEIGADTDPNSSRQSHDALAAARGLGSYRRPLLYAESLFAAAEQLIRDSVHAEAHRRLPVELFSGLVEREGTTSEFSSPRALSLGAYSVSACGTGELRSRLRALLVDLSLNGGDRTRPAAASILGEMLRQPHGYYGHALPSEQLHQWKPEQLAILADINAILASTDDALVAWTLRDGIQWHREHSALRGVKTNVRRVLRDHPAGTEEGILDALVTNGIGRFADSARIDRERTRLARELRSEYPTPRSLLDRLDQAIERLTRCRPDRATNVGPILTALAGDVDWAIDAAELLLDEPGRCTAQGISIILGEVLKSRPNSAHMLLRRAATDANPTLRRAAADHVSRTSWLGDPTAPERAIAVTLAADDDPVVVALVLLAALRCADHDPALATSILLAVHDLSLPQLAEDACMALRRPLALTDHQWQQLLDKLLNCPCVGYWYDRMLVDRAATHWRQILDHVLARIHQRENDYDYAGLPSDDLSGDLLQAHPGERRQVLAEVLAHLAQNSDGRPSVELPLLFWSASATGEETLNAIADALAGSAKERIAATLVISAGGRRFLDAPEWITQQLEGSPRGKPLNELRSALSGALCSGLKQGLPGEPFQEDVELEVTARQHAAVSPAGSRARDFWTRTAAYAAAEMQRAVEQDDDY